MEFAIVRYPTSRQVFVDGGPSGWTNQVIFVDEGFHEFDLGSPRDYQPPIQTVAVVGTTSISPKEVSFAPLLQEAATPPAAGGRTARAARARPRPAAKRSPRKPAARKPARGRAKPRRRAKRRSRRR